MLKKSFQIIGLILLICFSFFYTEKVVMVVNNQDPLMIKIKEYGEVFNIESVDAITSGNSVIPGINACVVDTNESYSNMKRIGSYNENMIEYKEIKPKLSLDKTYDKYIIKGNKKGFEVALVFKVRDSSYILEIANFLHKKGIKASFFVDGKQIEEDSQNIYVLINNDNEIYNLGYDGKYNKDLLIWTNNMIENMSKNIPKYCIVSKEDEKVIDMCADNKMYTIKSSVEINYNTTFNDVKSKIEKGSIIVFDTNNKTIDELSKTILFLNSKGYNYNLLSDHLSEKGCNFKKK